MKTIKVIVYSQEVPHLVAVPSQLWVDACREKNEISSLEYYAFSYRRGWLKFFNRLIDFIESAYKIRINIWKGIEKLKQSENV